jgi:hypothetical protein
MKLWNELEFETQSDVLLKILNLMDEEKDKKTKRALKAAFFELRMWSNFPCPTIDSPNAVQAQDSYEE